MAEDLAKRAAEAERRLAELTTAFSKLQTGLGAEVARLQSENTALKKQQQSTSTPSSSSSAVSAPISRGEYGQDAFVVKEPWELPEQPSLKDRVSLRTIFANHQAWIGKRVAVACWIRFIRAAGGGAFNFLQVYDGTSPDMLQVLLSKDTPGFDLPTQPAASVFILGTVVASQGRGQAIELQATSLELLGTGFDADKYPLSGKGLSLEYLRNHAHLRARTQVLGAAMRVRNAVAFATHQFHQSRGFKYVHTPLISCSDCEGGGEMFQVTTMLDDGKLTALTKQGTADYSKDFFGKPAYLTVSGQLNVETYCLGLSNVYTFGPTFRAENSHTSRHLAEFWMIEPEIAFADLDENIGVATDFLKYVIHTVLQTCDGELGILEQFEVKRAAELLANQKKADAEENKNFAELVKKLRAEGKPVPKKKKNKGKAAGAWKKGNPLRERMLQVATADFANVTYTEAVELLQKHVEEKKVSFNEEVTWGMDLGSEHERYLCEEHFKKPTIVRNYPKGIKAFYMRMNEDGKTVRAMDMLVPGIGELMGGSQREERLDALEKRMEELGLVKEDYWWYLDMRRYGGVPHSGFGVGFERLVQYVTGLDNIRDVIPFPRYPGNAEF